MNNTDANNLLNVTTNDGKLYQIYVIKTFAIDQYPNKEYIAYTFGEEKNDMVKSYASVMNSTNGKIILEAITDRDEWNMVQEGLKELLLEQSEDDV